MTEPVRPLEAHHFAPVLGAAALAGYLGAGFVPSLLAALAVALFVLLRHRRPR